MSSVNLNGSNTELIESIQILLMSEENYLQEIKLLKERVDRQDIEIKNLKYHNKFIKDNIPSCVNLKTIYG